MPEDMVVMTAALALSSGGSQSSGGDRWVTHGDPKWGRLGQECLNQHGGQGGLPGGGNINTETWGVGTVSVSFRALGQVLSLFSSIFPFITH